MKKILNKKNILYYILLFSILLFLICGLLRLDNITFFCASISVNLLLIIIIKSIISKFKIKYKRNEIITIVISIIILYIFYIVSILTRKFIYYWDYSCYYNIQMTTIDSFKIGLITGIKSFISSTWAGEYGSFLNFIPQLIFNFTNKSINSYLISCVLLFIPYIIISFSIVIKRIIHVSKELKKYESKFFILSILVLITMPLLHGTFIYGQPDVFGLVFIFLIISLTIDYNFKKIEFDRLTMILLSTYMLTICRRWYIYWIISYYLLYIIHILFNNKKDIKKIIKNIIIYGIIVSIIYLVTLFPFIKNTISSNYSSAYSFYSNGGALYELGNQVKHLGYLVSIIIIGGLIYGLINKKYRKITILNIIQYIFTIVMFTRIQTMGIHHSLLLLPNYLFGIGLFIICVLKNKKTVSITVLSVFIMIISINILYSYQKKDSYLFTDIRIKTPEEINYKSIKETTDWLEENLNKDNTAYMIVHNNTFNPDKFRNFYTPNSRTHKYLPYGSAIVGVHKFPIELFTARYVITTDPYEPTSVDEKYNKVFNELVDEGKFSLKKQFVMQDKTTILIYERIKEVDESEKNKYLEALKEESKEYNNLYEKVIQDFK